MTERAIFIAALEKGDPRERDAYLQAACGPDTALRQRIETLLKAHEQAGHTMEQENGQAPTRLYEPDQQPTDQDGTTPSGETPTVRHQAEGPGTRIGPYKLLQQIGEGGMGAVYMA